MFQPSKNFTQYSPGILAHSAQQNWCQFIKFEDLLAHKCFFTFVHKLSIELGSGPAQRKRQHHFLSDAVVIFLPSALSK